MSAWIGLAGVALGALLGAGTTWLQRYWSERYEQRRSLSEAINELPIAAHTLLLTLQAYRSSDRDDGSLLAWSPLMTSQMEKVLRSAGIIRQYSTPFIAEKAEAIANAIIPPSPRVKEAVLSETKLHDAIEEFTLLIRITRR